MDLTYPMNSYPMDNRKGEKVKKKIVAACRVLLISRLNFLISGYTAVFKKLNWNCCGQKLGDTIGTCALLVLLQYNT
ncbi:MAG: hypothetical protein ACJA2S_004403 [Cyclobacteriaceae bacterium]|jgi:hypothetical protein